MATQVVQQTHEMAGDPAKSISPRRPACRASRNIRLLIRRARAARRSRWPSSLGQHPGSRSRRGFVACWNPAGQPGIDRGARGPGKTPNRRDGPHPPCRALRRVSCGRSGPRPARRNKRCARGRFADHHRRDRHHRWHPVGRSGDDCATIEGGEEKKVSGKHDRGVEDLRRPVRRTKADDFRPRRNAVRPATGVGTAAARSFNLDRTARKIRAWARCAGPGAKSSLGAARDGRGRSAGPRVGAAAARATP